MKSLILVLCVLVPLSACQDGGGVGSGPLTLAPEIQASFRDYLKEDRPFVFVVSTDGNAAVSVYCPVGPDSCYPSSDTFRALEKCRELSKEVPCKIYAKGHDIVWKGASDYALAEGEHVFDVNKTVQTAQWNSLCRQAEEGDGPARSGIGSHYRYGWFPVEPDLVQAYKWYSLAVKAGYGGAAEYKQDLLGQMTAKDIVEAERLAAQWKLGECKIRGSS